MKTKILPLVWYITAVIAFLAVLAAGARTMKPIIVVAMAWLTSLIAASLAGWLAVALKPELRSSTKDQVDGSGYLHQFKSIVIHMTFWAICWGVLFALKR